MMRTFLLRWVVATLLLVPVPGAAKQRAFRLPARGDLKLAVEQVQPDGAVRRIPVRVRPLRKAELKQFQADLSGEDRILAQWRATPSMYYRWTAADQAIIDDVARRNAFLEMEGRFDDPRPDRRVLPKVLVGKIQGTERILGVLYDHGPGLVHADATLRGRDYADRVDPGRPRIRGIGSALYAHRLLEAFRRGEGVQVEAVNAGSRAFHQKLGFQGPGRDMFLPPERIPDALRQIWERQGR